MRIAIAHDWLDVLDGGFKVVKTVANNFDSIIYTTNYEPEKIQYEFKEVESHPLRFSGFKGFRQIEAAKKFSKMEIEADILFASGPLAKFSCINNHPNIWYCYTPMREIYDLYKFSLFKLGIINRQFFRIWARIMRSMDQESVKHVDEIVSISNNVSERIQNFYKRKSITINAPVDISKFKHRKSEGFFLSVQRLYSTKRVDIQIDAFKNIKKELLIVGDGPEIQRLKRIATPNIKFLGEVSEKKLNDLYSRCEAVIQTAKNEDFGLVPVEAMASGKPTIAVNEGGFKETMTDKTGILLSEPYAENLRNSIENFHNYKFKRKDLQKRARDFSEQIFVKKLRKVFESMVDK